MLKINLFGYECEALDEAGFLSPSKLLPVYLNRTTFPEEVYQYLLTQFPELAKADKVVIALPVLSPLTAVVIAWTVAITGSLPVIQPLEETFKGYMPVPQINLQDVSDKSIAP